MEQKQSEKQYIFIEPTNLMLVAMVVGAVAGLLVVVLDPWLRFPDSQVVINWREAMLTASMGGTYGALLGWIITTFWRSILLWGAVFFTAPIVTGVLVAWNDINAGLGVSDDLITTIPIIMVVHLLGMVTVVGMMVFALRTPFRRPIAFLAIPVVVLVLTFGGVARQRWESGDAQTVVAAASRYADGVVEGNYHIEYLGIRYREELVPTGTLRIYSDSPTLYCVVRLFPQTTDVSCQLDD